MNLVVGATGLMGAEVCARLVSQHQPVRALVRTTSEPGKVRHLHTLGVNTVVGDLRDRRSLDVACSGITAVIATASSMPFAYDPARNTPDTTDRDGMQNLIAAARVARVQHFVLTSFSGAIDADFPLRNAKRAAEDHLRNSGVPFTILRPNFFMEVWLSPAVGFDYAHGRVKIYGEGTNPIEWIAVPDVARYAIASVDHPAVRNATVELGGPDALNPLEVIALFERVGGRTFAVEHVAPEEIAAQEAAATDPMQRSFAALMRAYARGAVHDRARQREFLIRPSSVEEYAKRVVSPWEGLLQARR